AVVDRGDGGDPRPVDERHAAAAGEPEVGDAVAPDDGVAEEQRALDVRVRVEGHEAAAVAEARGGVRPRIDPVAAPGVVAIDDRVRQVQGDGALGIDPSPEAGACLTVGGRSPDRLVAGGDYVAQVADGADMDGHATTLSVRDLAVGS